MPPRNDSLFDRPIVLGDIFSRYKFVVWIVSAFLIAAGFGFETPAHRFNEMDKAYKSELARINGRADSLATVIRELRPLIETSAIISCLSVKGRDAAPFLLTCERLLNKIEVPR